jgi:hypothetical protein
MKKISVVLVALAILSTLPCAANAADGFVPPGPGQFQLVSKYLIWMSDKAEVGNPAYQWQPGMDPSQYKDQTIIHLYRQKVGQNASPDAAGAHTSGSKQQIIETASDNSAAGTSGSASQ